MAPNRGGLLFLLLTFLLVTERRISATRCNREPEGRQTEKSPVAGRFRIKISGNPEKYVPGEIYTVTLQGSRNQQISQKFTGFMLTVEPLDSRSAFMNDVNVGSFQLFNDALTKFSERCPNTVTQTSSMPKPEIQVLWTAPNPGVGCLVFRAMVVEQRDVWYQDDGPLSRILCEDVQESLDEQPQIIDPCCACDEAKYELTFEGIWSRHTHPKDFPNNSWLTRFSDVIGASHTADYRFWEYGGISSEGVRQVAEKGSTRMLESELKAESEHIRTIIKARGISYPNITGKTFGLFRVNRHHHLISVVSRIDPSPDWIVGVSGLELCLRNCSWVESKILNLYPWDAGTDSGMTYISADAPTTPRDTIRRITSSFPNDPRSPFYDPTGEEMKPLARLYLTRQRLYEKSCADDGQNSYEDVDVNSSEMDECKVGDWSEWSECSASCGRGYKTRQRYYLNQLKAQIDSCERQLTARLPCIGTHPTCPPSKGHGFASENPLCATTEWTHWSSCSVTCGHGVKTRSRRYVDPRQARKVCNIHLEQNEVCYAAEDCPPDLTSDVTQQLPAYCRTTHWSEWSPCSATCGQGRKHRNRLFQLPNVPIHLQEKCNLNMVEQVQCEAEVPDCDIGSEDFENICKLEKDVGPCRGYQIRWYFDAIDRECHQFAYGTCKGNRNNFEQKEDCEKACAGLKGSENGTIAGISTDSHKHHPSLETSVISTVPPVTANIGLQVDCEVTPWSKWSSCSVTCGRGWKVKSRTIRIHSSNGGKPCPPRLLKRRKCKERSCDQVDHPSWGELPGVESLTIPTGESPWPLPGHYAQSSEEVPEQHYSYGTVVTGPELGGGGDCLLSPWSPWSPCSQSCGSYAVQQRTRSITSNPWGNGRPCPPRLQRRSCVLLPCQR